MFGGSRSQKNCQKLRMGQIFGSFGNKFFTGTLDQWQVFNAFGSSLSGRNYHSYSIIYNKMKSVDKHTEQKALLELAYRIKSARKDAHLSQAALGESIGVSDKSVSAYEKGRSTPPFEKLKKIAQQTNHSLSYFTQEKSEEMTIVNKLYSIEQELEEIRKLLKKSRK